MRLLGMEHDAIDHLPRIADYLAGELSLDEMAATARWIDEDAERLALVAQLRQAKAAHLEAMATPFSVERMVRGVTAGITRTTEPRTLAIARRGHQHRSSSSWRIVAAACVAICAWIVSRQFISSPSDQTHSFVRYTTKIGQQAILTLSDGSRVRLAPQTTLRVASNFGGTSRTIELDGEAYFDVPHANGTPFIVHTGSATTRVLGTTFDIRKYSAESATQVAVTAGRVTVGGRRQMAPVILAAGMMSVVGDSVGIVTHDAMDAVAWTSNRMIFHKAPLTTVLAALTRWYGFEFRYTDSSLTRENLTLGLSTESPSRALATLQQLLEVDATVDGHIVTLRPKSTSGHRITVPERMNHFSSPYTEVGR